jgi:hypothetical protein
MAWESISGDLSGANAGLNFKSRKTKPEPDIEKYLFSQPW